MALRLLTVWPADAVRPVAVGKRSRIANSDGRNEPGTAQPVHDGRGEKQPPFNVHAQPVAGAVSLNP